MSRRHAHAILVAVATVAGASACADVPATTPLSGAGRAGPAGDHPDAQATPSLAFGHPVTPPEASGIVVIDVGDDGRCRPQRIPLRSGDARTFVVNNASQQEVTVQLGRDTLVVGGTDPEAAGDRQPANVVVVAPEDSGAFSWRFSTPMTVPLACGEQDIAVVVSPS